jgi:hypothetical protein
MIEQAVTITSDEIVILGQFFVHKDYSITRKDLLIDVLAKKYCGQRIVIKLFDGENTNFSGFESFIKYICDILNIPYSDVTFETHGPELDPDFNLTQLKLGIFISVNQYLPESINKDLSNAKFVGTTLGRYNLSRLRLAYELDRAFPNDTYITFQPNKTFLNETLKHFSSHYTEELAWLQDKTFDRDLTSKHHMGMIDWYDACRSYGNVWNKFQIEIVSETDCMDNFWFTEKTANCLATGKPFVLVSGKGSLKRLRDMGFTTFNSVIDESYDDESNPYDRITHLTSSLQLLYTSPRKAEKLELLYHLARQNITLYQQYCVR